MEGNNNNPIRRNIISVNLGGNHRSLEQLLQVINTTTTMTPQPSMNISTNPIIIPIIRDLNDLLNRGDSDLLEESFNNDEKRKIRPLSHEVRDKLGEYKVTDEDIASNLSCAICQNNFKKDDKVIRLPCGSDGHFFHKGENKEECLGIMPWLKENNTCPVCRYEFESEPEPDDPDNILDEQETDDDGSGENNGIEGAIDEILEQINVSIEGQVQDHIEDDDEAEEEGDGGMSVEGVGRPNVMQNLYLNMINNMVDELNGRREEEDMQAAIMASMNDR
tara:strand:+ start:3474 stop:4304 length:831 start_codon:yes stop_codon:yes gene_type:complete